MGGSDSLLRAAGGLTVGVYALITHLFELGLSGESHLRHRSDYEPQVGGIITPACLEGA